MMKKRVVVAMSGGVDSAVAAALLQKQGYEVIGITLCFGLSDSRRRKPSCCGLQGIEDARRVTHKLEIRHYVLNMHRVLQERVIKDFCREYCLGRTPNPCIRCNQYIKFGALLKKALALGAQFLATGHYARISVQRAACSVQQRYLLKKSKDKFKDQSYFLYRLNQFQLRHTLFPLGNYTKDKVRQLAREFSLPVADKAASQEICFLPEDNYREFLKVHSKKKIEPGLIMDQQGNVLGKHKGIAFYTIGQRQGLGIAKGYRVYVAKIDPQGNKIIIGEKEDVFGQQFLVSQPHFILHPLKKKIAAKVKIRYNHPEAEAVLEPFGRKIRVCFKKKQFAITPGQAAVFYRGETALGGGVIDEVLG